MIDKNLPALLPLAYLLAAVLIPLCGLRKQRTAWAIALMATWGIAALSIYGFCHVIAHGTIDYHFGGWIPPVGIEYVYDTLAAFICMVVNLIACLVVLHSKRIVPAKLKEKTVVYYSVTMLLLLGFNGIILTGDLFNLFVFIEISSLSMYGLIAVGGKRAPLAAFRYLIIGSIGASFYLLGVGFIYFASGTLNMQDFASMMPELKDNPAVIIALTLMTVGIATKTAIFPMHGWLVDAYSEAPSTSSALIAGVGTKVSAYVLIRILFFVFGIEFFKSEQPLGEIIAILSCCGILYGSVMALAQKDLKRMLAFSSVGQIGYVGLGIGLANPFAFVGAVLHILNHALMKACLFLVIGTLFHKTGHANIARMDSSYRIKYPWTMAAFTVTALSMIGLPPLAGFFNKWYLAIGALEADRWFYLGVILLSSLLNAGYFFRILEKVYLKPQANNVSSEGASSEENVSQPVRDEAPFSMLFPTLALAGGVLVLGILNMVIVEHLFKILP